MSGVHSHALHLHGHSPVHRLAPEVKLAAMVGFVLGVVLTPREAVWAFPIHGLLVMVVLGIAQIPPGFYLRRVTIELPFVLFALALPFVGVPPDVELAGMSLSVEGLWGAWNILVKATLGVSASIILAATTEVPDILRGMDRLRVPRLLTAIAGFMVRYLDLIIGEVSRARTAMSVRGYNPRWWWQARPLAASAGALFIRSYERGERVHQAMLARGYSGTMPVPAGRPAGRSTWIRGMSGAALAWAVMVLAVIGT